MRESSVENNHFSFTTARLGAVPTPAAGATQVYDDTTPGLAMRVTHAGARTFVFFRRVDGRVVRMKLGTVKGMTISDARKAAQQLAGRAAAGVNIVAERAAARIRGRTVSDAFSAWMAFAKHRNRTWEAVKRSWELWIEGKPTERQGRGKRPDDSRPHKSFPALARRPIREVTTAELERVIRQIGETNPRTANKVRALLCTVWNHAMRRGDVTANPVRFVARFPECSRERFLQESELEAFLRAVMQEPPTWRDYFLVALLTGQRREALCRMRWEEIDLQSGCWHMSATKTKNKRATTIPLTALAVRLLLRRREEVVGEWVFPSYIGSEVGCVREPRVAWNRILKHSGLSDLRIHDLRRSVGSWLGASGTNSYTIAKALGHLSVRSGEAYVRLGTDPVRNAMQAIQDSRPCLESTVNSAHAPEPTTSEFSPNVTADNTLT
jgi:integrase